MQAFYYSPKDNATALGTNSENRKEYFIPPIPADFLRLVRDDGHTGGVLDSGGCCCPGVRSGRAALRQWGKFAVWRGSGDNGGKGFIHPFIPNP